MELPPGQVAGEIYLYRWEFSMSRTTGQPIMSYPHDEKILIDSNYIFSHRRVLLSVLEMNLISHNTAHSDEHVGCLKIGKESSQCKGRFDLDLGLGLE